MWFLCSSVQKEGSCFCDCSLLHRRLKNRIKNVSKSSSSSSSGLLAVSADQRLRLHRTKNVSGLFLFFFALHREVVAKSFDVDDIRTGEKLSFKNKKYIYINIYVHHSSCCHLFALHILWSRRVFYSMCQSALNIVWGADGKISDTCSTLNLKITLTFDQRSKSCWILLDCQNWMVCFLAHYASWKFH